MSDEPILSIEGLDVSFGRGKRRVTVVHDVDLRIDRGEIVGIVGESGSGKTLTSMAMADLLPGNAERTTTAWSFAGADLTTATRRQRAVALGGKLAVVFQDPMSSLNPARRVGAQLIDTARFWEHRSRSEALADAVERLRQVRIAGPERQVRAYPHELSGGMRQRAMIAMGLMTTPSLIIADEPTTALDVTVQADIIELLGELNRTERTAILLVSHNIALISEICDRVLVMYAGRIVEEVDGRTLLSSARHPYTRALLSSIPSLDSDPTERISSIPGSPPDPAHLPPGCAYADRCPIVTDHCRVERPPLVDGVACWEVH